MAEKVAKIKTELDLAPDLPLMLAVREANAVMCIEAKGTLPEQVAELITQLGINFALANDVLPAVPAEA